MVNDNNGDAIASEGAAQATTASKPIIKKRNAKRKQNFAQIHKDALPLEVYPLPAFHPTHPLSVLQLIWTCLKQLAYPPSSHPAQQYLGYMSKESRSVHITEPAHVRALWERGFFGKGTLSRSEPSWMDREKARIAARSQGGQTAEEVTKARREERRLFKLERARIERERIERQRLMEQGKLVTNVPSEGDTLLDNAADIHISAAVSDAGVAGSIEPVDGDLSIPLPNEDLALYAPDIENQEHLQLTLEEAFFLKYALGVLDIHADGSPDNVSLTDNRDLFDLFRHTSKFDTSPMGMDDQFILNYVVYHHFRSLGWVIRPGVKFSVDYLLYNRGPVFSHAEFAILIMPSYSDPYWSTSEGRSKKRMQDQKDWWWLHCINRVQSQVKKTLVLCFVDIPPPCATDEELTVRALLSRYKIREFIVRRWLMNRSRD
ncbi:hypothetical protein AMS68_007468 [Peltaster fructicola]|uniref:tRNA-splicing endonuclease subunit Sen2 n=1 Tax=Peltaster fructicola TaxID=286661 RepID=A0A6H0Y4V5_9PEZI|nr:hypothetical protein AMS68_007468 [Peltaster fructicola]